MTQQRGPVPRHGLRRDALPVPYLTVAEEASFRRVGVADVVEAIQDGTLPVFSGGGEPLIDRLGLFRTLDPLYGAPPTGSLRGRVDTAARVCEEIVGEGYVSAAWRAAAASRLLGDLVDIAWPSRRLHERLRPGHRPPQACLDALAPAYRPRRRPPLRRVNSGASGRGDLHVGDDMAETSSHGRGDLG
jgi:hypothetical protein